MAHLDGESAGILVLAVLGPVCCLGLPLLLAAGAGAGLWVIGAAVPVVLIVAVGGFLIGRWWRARHRAWRPVDRAATARVTEDRP